MMVVTVFLLVCLAVKVIHADEECQNTISCPCGNTGENVTICAVDDTEVCTRLSKCKKCEGGWDVCSECPEGFQGLLCSEAVQITCENPGPISNGKITFSIPAEIEGSKMKILPVNTVMHYFCDEGYQLKGPKSLTCEPTGLWSAEVPTCDVAVQITCENPGPISNGKITFSIPAVIEGSKMKTLPVNTVMHYFCDVGYKLKGPKSLTCEPTGLWSAEVPTCDLDKHINCKYPGHIRNGKSQFSHPTVNIGQEMNFFPLETVREFSCNEGYHLPGSNFSTCVTHTYCSYCPAHWSPEQTKCEIDCGRDFYNFGPCTRMGCNNHAPWVVSISVRNDDDNLHQVCLGTLLNHNTILTTADCLAGHSTFIIQFGRHYLRNRDDNPQVIIRRSSRMLLHPDFSNITFDSNIGLLFFEPRIRLTVDVQPICLQDQWNSQEDSEVGRKGTVSYKERNTESNGLSFMTVLSVESCTSANLFITKNSFCAGTQNGLQSICERNIGAPFFFYNRSKGRFELLGIASFSTRHSCDIEGNYAVFTKHDNFRKWIDENLQEFV